MRLVRRAGLALLSSLFLLLGCHVGRYELARELEPEARTWIERHAVSARVDDDAAIEAIARSVGTAKVVAAGEATHGTREFATFRLRLFQALVEHHGFRVFALEAEYGRVLPIDAYASGEPGDPRAMLSQLNWVWYTQEMLDVVEWIRAFNRGRPFDDQIRVYGFDSQTSGASLAHVCARLHEAAVAEAAEPCRKLATLVPAPGTDARPPRYDVSEEELVRGNALVQQLESIIATHDAALRGRYGEHGWARSRHALEIAHQSLAVARSSDPVHFEPRDSFMAANVVWMEQLERKPVFVWAHDGHTMRGTFRSHKNRAYWSEAPMGWYLGQHYARADFVSIGTIFTTGSFNAVVMTGMLGPVKGLRAAEAAEPVRHSLDAVLGEAASALGPYALDLRRADPTDPSARWFREFHLTRMMTAGYIPTADRTNVLGGNWRGIIPVDAYDWLVVLGPTTPTTMLETGEIQKGKGANKMMQ